MSQTTPQTGEAFVVQPAGDMVAPALPGLRQTMRDAVASGAREMVVDFSKVTMLDSSGIGLLIAAHNSVRRMGGRLSVIHASREIIELLQTMRIHQHFSVAGD